MKDKRLQQYQSMVSSSLDMLALCDKDFVYRIVNQAFASAFQKSIDEMVGRRQVDSELDQAFFNSTLKPNAELCLAGRTVHFQAWVNFPAFKKRFIDITFTPYRDQNNKIDGMIIRGQDITQRKQAEEALHRNILETQSVFNASPIPLLVVDSDRKIQQSNRAAQMFAKQTEEEMLGRTGGDVLRCLHSMDVPEGCGFGPICQTCTVRNTVLETFRTQEAALNIEAELPLLIEDQYFNRSIRLNTTFFLGSSGPRVVVALEDITERKRAESELKISEELNRSLTQTAVDAIISINVEGKIWLWNHAAERIFGYSPSEMLGQSLEKIIPSQYAASHFTGLKRLQAGGSEKLLGKTIEISARRKDGTEFPVELSLSSWETNNQKQYTAFIRDTTYRKQAESDLIDALRETEKANSVKDQFLANVSHEIRTPLTSIIGFTSLLKKSLEEMSETDGQLSFIKFIEQASDRLLRTVDSILNVSQLEAGTIQLTRKQLQLSALVRSVCDELQPSAVEKGLELEFLSSAEDDNIQLDEYSICQALLNLIQNAIKFTHEGGVTVRLKRMEDLLILKISDTGIGISEEYHQRMFQPFSQESEGFTKDYQGIGMGLALTKRYLDLNQVDIQVESAPGQGSTFTLKFPIRQVEND